MEFCQSKKVGTLDMFLCSLGTSLDVSIPDDSSLKSTLMHQFESSGVGKRAMFHTEVNLQVGA